MSSMARAFGRVPLTAAFALILTFGVLPAKANDLSVWAALERPDDALLSGLQGCGHALDDGMSGGSRCLVGWTVDHLLLDALTRFASEQGQMVFGEHFRIANSLSYSPYGDGLNGGIDVVLPLMSSTASGSASSRSSALFFQQGVTRWIDEHGSTRNDIRVGVVRRFGLTEENAMSDVVGISAFVQQSREFQHTRLVASSDYAGTWGGTCQRL